MPTVTRFLVTIGVIAAIVYGAMIALATFVKPRRGEMIVDVPLDLKPPTPPVPTP